MGKKQRKQEAMAATRMPILEYIDLLRGRDTVWPSQEDHLESVIDSDACELIHKEFTGVRGSSILGDILFHQDSSRFALLLRACYPEARAHLASRKRPAEGWATRVQEAPQIIVDYQGRYYDISGDITDEGWNLLLEDLSDEELRSRLATDLVTLYDIVSTLHLTPQETERSATSDLLYAGEYLTWRNTLWVRRMRQDNPMEEELTIEVEQSHTEHQDAITKAQRSHMKPNP